MATDDRAPSKRLESLAREAIEVARKARKHGQSLGGVGFYAKKLAELRIAATNAFTDLKSGTAGDTSALVELLTLVFSASTPRKVRIESERELIFSLRTTWREHSTTQATETRDFIFPITLLEQTKRGYLIILGRQMNGCFSVGYYDACAVMMRRLFEIAIIEAFEAKGVQQNIKDQAGDYLQLSDLISRALAEPTMTFSRNTKRAMPKLRDAGHLSAHGRSFFAQKTDIERVQQDFRIAVEELLRVAGLV
jgi:hypothetical protein